MTEGLTVSHACEIAAVCREIKTLLQMEETVEGIDDDKQIQAFLYNLSAFLLELGCPYEEFSSGPIDARFSDAEARNRLVNYLKDEFKAAQLTAAQRLENLKPDSVEEDEDRVLLCSALEAVGSTYSNQPLGEIFSLLYQEVDKRMQRFVTAPKIMFKASMDENKWRQVEECCAMLLKDFRARTILLLKRLDVSVNSFLWTDRLQKMEDEIRGEYARRVQPHLIRYNPMQVWHLLAATDDILYIESASNYANRRNTKCPTHPLATGKAPKDRGGRTSEQTPVRNETFAQQRAGRGRGGGGQHHGGGRGRGNYQQQQQQHQDVDRRSNEQRTRDEYTQHQQQQGNDHGDGFHQHEGRGRGRGRGHYY
ncbi:hypothetical protein WR25_27299 isoform A [Diploscapter pachys]|uniref:Uncharacterized protein n=1 Tax=Diploscapter pachys TaxID=2018661 RepID=A0A2A2K5T8_9BILA|nr:hypothetical protein WR25_27299 isoform A [Diploscapter pachys]